MTVVSDKGHDLSGTTARRPTNAEPGMIYCDTDLNVMCFADNTSTMKTIAGHTGAATVAAAGTNQATAAALTSSVTNNVTGADGTKGVLLPVITVPGNLTRVYNSSSSQILKVYPAGTATINGGSASASVSVPPLAYVNFNSVSATNWAYSQPGNLIAPTIAYNAVNPAAAGTNQGNATAITIAAPGVIHVTGADATKGVVLPAATAGAVYLLKNDDAANAVLKVYPAGTDTINALSASGAISLAAKVACTFFCTTNGAWYTAPLLPS